MDLGFLSATALAELVRSRRVGCVEVLDHFIDRVERLDGPINAVVVRDFDRARDRAADRRAAPRDLFQIETGRHQLFGFAQLEYCELNLFKAGLLVACLHCDIVGLALITEFFIKAQSGTITQFHLCQQCLTVKAAKAILIQRKRRKKRQHRTAKTWVRQIKTTLQYCAASYSFTLWLFQITGADRLILIADDKMLL